MRPLRPRLDPVLRSLPHGPWDVVRQAALFYGCYLAYSVVRGYADEPGAVQAAFDNARAVIALEQALHVFVEPTVQTWATGSSLLADATSWIYLNAQTSVTVGALLFVYLFRNASFCFVRNMMLVAMGLALAGYALFPTAPPRLLPEWGFTDSVARFTGIDPDGDALGALVNPYAAMPSMHLAFALMIGGSLARLVRHRLARILWLAYPAIILFVIVATANHFLLDGVLGGVVAAVSAAAARELARMRPAAWRFGPEPAAP